MDSEERKDPPAGWNQPRNLLIAVMLLAAAAAVGVAIWMATRPMDISSGLTDEGALTNDEIIMAQAKRLVDGGKPVEAVKMLRKYLKDNPESADPRVMLAEAYVRLRQWDKCEQQLDELLAFKPDHPEALWLKGECLEHKSLGGGLDHFRRAAAQPEAGHKIWGMWGLMMMTEGKVSRARKFLTKARDAGSRSSKVYHALGRIALQEKNHKEARRFLRYAVEIKPDNGDAWCDLAMAQLALEQEEDAMASLKICEKTVTGINRGIVLRTMGELHVRKANWYDAGEAFAGAAEYPPERGKTMIRAAMCYYFADRPEGHELGKAMACIDAAHELLGEDPEVLKWKKKIEDARFGSAGAKDKPSESFLKFKPEIE